jgi:hypothetical protein
MHLGDVTTSNEDDGRHVLSHGKEDADSSRRSI